MKAYTMLVVRDVPASSKWYQQLLELEGAHGGDEFEMLMNGHDITLLLHHVDVAEHPALSAPAEGAAGAGVLLYFSVDEVEAVFQRAKAMGADVIDEPRENPLARAVEFSLRDLDGYALTVSQSRG